MDQPRKDWQNQRGGRIDSTTSPGSPLDGEDRIDEYISESFPASDPPSWSSGLDEDPNVPPKE